MYAGGAAHPLKQLCIDILQLVADDPRRFVTDAEVLQEMLHRYRAQRTLAQGIVMLREFEELMRGRITPMMAEDVLLAASLTSSLPSALAARDLIHLAVMRRLDVTRIISADQGFDGLPGVERLDPAEFEEWRASLAAESS